MTPETKHFGPIEITFDASCDDAVSAALSMLAHALSKLVAKERYARLEAIEDGSLRSLVAGYVTARLLNPYRHLALDAKGHRT
jgi:hypothetical protein